MNQLASALKQLLRLSKTHWEKSLKHPTSQKTAMLRISFNSLKKCLLQTIGQKWKPYYTFGRIRKTVPRECWSHANLKEMLEALRSKYGLTI